MTLPDEIDPCTVREELDRVLTSETFSQSQMAIAFLQYVVGESLEGRADRIKGYTIAVEALDKPDSFDPANNPLVRVQAKRLRDLLDRYYESEGQASPLRIELPVGGYAPEFIRKPNIQAHSGDQAVDPDATDRPFAPPKPIPNTAAYQEIAVGPARHRRLFYGLIAGLGVAILLVAAVVKFIDPTIIQGDPHAERTELIANASVANGGLDASDVLPLLEFRFTTSSDLPAWFDGERYLDRLKTFAARFGDYVIVQSDSNARPLAAGQPKYVLDFDFVARTIDVYATVLVIHQPDNRLVTSYSFGIAPDQAAQHVIDPKETTPFDLQTLRSLIQPNGPIFADTGSLVDVSAPLSCLYKSHRFFVDGTTSNHLYARDCLEETIRDNPRLAQAFNLLGAIYLEEYRRELNLLPGDTLERAEAAVRQAIRLAPLSSSAHRILQSVLVSDGNEQEALVAGRRAVELNPDDIEAIGNYGSLLAQIGSYQDAIPMLRRVLSELSPAPQWAYFFTFLSLNNLGRTDEADKLAGYFLRTQSSLYLTAVILRASRRGAESDKKAAIKSLLDVEPGFQWDPFQPYRRRGLADSVIERLLQDLKAAGAPVETSEKAE